MMIIFAHNLSITNRGTVNNGGCGTRAGRRRRG